MSGSTSVEIDLPADDTELREFTRIASQALFFPGVDLDAWVGREGRENVRVARRDGVVVGGLVIQRMGQWFGGRSVPMGAVRAVGVAPEHRVAGVASQLMRTSLAEMHRDGIPISTLFPATQPVYRRPGYEQAGVRLMYQMPTATIDVRERSLTLRPIEPGDHEAVYQAYGDRSRRTSGNLDRNDWCWRRVFDPPPWLPKTYGYLVERDSRVRGYAVYAQKEADRTTHKHELELVDLVFLSPDAGRRLLTFLADHRSMAPNVRWCGAPAEPTLLLPAEQACSVVHRIDWMLRIVDVPRALEMRGYPPTVDTQVDFDVHDDILAHNNGRFVLEVSESQGHVRRGGNGDVRIDIRGLAPLYTGHLSPCDLKAVGYVDASDEDLAKAGSLFAGPAPWMPDIF